jgi:hypothetical protein
MRFINGVFLLFMLIFPSLIIAQEESGKEKEEPKYGWEKKFIGTLNITQTSLSNWTQGGDNAWSWQANINGVFEQKEEKFDWKNTVQLLYGKSKIGSDDPKKTDDQIFLETVYTYRMGNSLNPYIGGSVLTQFTTGYDYSTKPAVKVSGFFDPGYIREGIGAEYKPSDKFDTRLGFSMRQTIADVYAATYSDDPATEETEKFLNQIGAESVTNFSTNLSKLIVFVTKLELFSELKAINQTVVRWDNLFSSKVAEYISVSFRFQLVFEPRVSIQRQLNQTLAVGLTYSLF